MDAFISQVPRRLAVGVAILGLALADCAGGAPSVTTGGGVEPSVSSSVGGGAGGPASAQGSIVSSGAYAATWTWQAGNAADPGMGGVTLTSDKGTFGNVEVLNDGSITFTSGAPELTAGSYKGTGAQVQVANGAPCSFTLDNDVTGSNGQVLHLKGSITISGGPFC